MKIICFFIVMISVFGACQNPKPKYIYNQGMAYGTVYHIVYESPKGIDFQDEITGEFKKYTMIFSTYEKESEISKINNNIEAKLSDVFITCFKKSLEISEITGGAFDITVGPLVFAWGFGPETRSEMTKEKVDTLLKLVGYRKIKLEDNKVKKDLPGIKIDMAAISKGYTSDLIAEFLKNKGCKSYMVEIGGEVVAHGVNEKGNTWTIGIQKPDENTMPSASNIQAKLKLTDHGMATSGNYMNFYVEDGKKYAHTIDPSTGYPVQHSLLSSTVLAGDCMTADAYATAFMVLGLEKSIEVAEKVPGLAVYFIYADSLGNNKVYMSDNFKEFLVE
jgi:thiamine biosynthesis lipoprotein